MMAANSSYRRPESNDVRKVRYNRKTVNGARVLELLAACVQPLTIRRGAARHPSDAAILVIEPFGLGDLVAATALFAALRREFPRARLEVACHERWSEWVGTLPFVDGVRSHRFPWSTSPKRLGVKEIWGILRFVAELRRGRFDIGIDIRGDIRSQALLAMAGCPTRVGFRDYMGSNVVQRGLLLTHAAECGVRPRLEELRDLLNLLGVNSPELHMDVGLEKRPLRGTTTPRIGIHVGAGWEFKKWSRSNWEALIDAVICEWPADVELIGSPADRIELEAIARAVSHRVSVCITKSVRALIEGISLLDLLICHDSAPVHIAAALDVPAIALFGAGEVTRWGKIAEGVDCLHHQDRFSCAPCTQKTCVSPTATCVNSIAPNEVLEKVRRRLPSALVPGVQPVMSTRKRIDYSPRSD